MSDLIDSDDSFEPSFIDSADSLETSIEIMEAIFRIAGGDDDVAVRVWEEPTETELINIWEDVTKNGLLSPSLYCWGDMGSKWANALTS